MLPKNLICGTSVILGAGSGLAPGHFQGANVFWCHTIVSDPTTLQSSYRLSLLLTISSFVYFPTYLELG